MKTIQLKIVGVSPFISHNGQTADPLNKFSKAIKEISGKRKKTDADYEEMARLEFLAGLYVSKGDIVLPSTVIEAAAINGAKKIKSGQQAKAGLFVEHHGTFEYEGPRNPDDLWANESFRIVSPVKIGMSKVMRTRPIFNKWSSVFTVTYVDDLINEATVLEAFKHAGQQCGVGDWRPKFGRFNVEKA